MKKSTLLLLLWLTLGTLVSETSVQAGTVYVPLVVEETTGGHRITSEIRATNNSESSGSLTYIFLPVRSDGTLPDREADSVTVALAPRQTVVLTDLLATGERGILEVTAGPDVSVTSRIVSVLADGRVTPGLEVPALTSDNMVAAGDTAALQGWRRDNGLVTDFYLLNLGHEATTCDVGIYRRQGSLIVRQPVPVLPLSLQLFSDVLALVGEARRNDASATITCDQAFHTFAVTVDPATSELVYIPPSGTGSSTLAPPGDEPEPPPPAFDCPGGAVFAKSGAFHRPRPGKETRRFEIPTVAGQIFTRLTVDVDFTPDDWADPSDGNHAVFWLNRTEKWAGNVFGYVNVFGPDKSIAKISTNADLPQGADLLAFKKNAVFEKGVRYHVSYVFDTAVDLMEAVFTVHTGTPDEEEVVRVTGRTTTDEIRTREPGFFVYFGHPTHAAGPEVPTYSWLYSNLCVQLE